jgi:hypothetical protein
MVIGSDFRLLGGRLRKRIIRVLDVVSILVLDSAMIGVGYGLERLLGHLDRSGSKSFEAARKFSEGLFLLMYLAWVVFDLWDYFEGEYRSRKQIEDAQGRAG